MRLGGLIALTSSILQSSKALWTFVYNPPTMVVVRLLEGVVIIGESCEHIQSIMLGCERKLLNAGRWEGVGAHRS